MQGSKKGGEKDAEGGIKESKDRVWEEDLKEQK